MTMDDEATPKPKKPRRRPAPPKRIADIRITKVALDALRVLADGGTILAQRTFPHPFRYQLYHVVSEDPKMPQEITEALVDTLVRTRCVEADGPGDTHLYRITERGREALAGRGYDVVEEQVGMFGEGV